MPAGALPMEDPTVVGHVVTWVIANGSALGIVYKVLTQPIQIQLTRHKMTLDDHEQRLDDLEHRRPNSDTPTSDLKARLRQLENQFDPRSSSPDIVTPGEIARRLRDLEEFQKDVLRWRSRMVTDDEFRAYTVQIGEKIENIIGALGFIKGRLGSFSREE